MEKELSIFDDHNDKTFTDFGWGKTKDGKFEPSTHIGALNFKSRMGILFDDKNDLDMAILKEKYDKMI